jgi:N6-L-threonylcarbamoyladenine synthase
MILSIESSCDDSSIAVTKIDTKELLFHKKISQELIHSNYGGVVPELASRLHIEAFPKILDGAKEFFPHLKAIAVTNSPGLAVTLIEGITIAKALSISLDIPLIGVNHLKGHIYSLFINKDTNFPLIALLTSGGHTQIIEVNSLDDMNIIASTMDDSFGESFDKVAKMMGLGYPGGPIIEQLAKNGDDSRFNFPIPLINSKELAFSYSGLKNAVRLAVENNELTNQTKSDIAASFQKSAVKHILHKLKKYLKTTKDKKFTRLAIVGGASANLYLRENIESLCREFNLDLELASLEFCSDNAAMIGRCAVDMYKSGDFITIENLDAIPRNRDFSK